MKLWITVIALTSWLSAFCNYQIGFEHLKEPDHSLSIEAIKSHAEENDLLSQALYGIFLYKKAEATVWAKERNQLYKEAAIWLKKAAAQEEPQANYYLGYAYYMGHGVPEDKEKSLKSFEQAVEKRLVPAMRCLAYSFLKRGQPTESLAWFTIVKELKKNECDIEYLSDRLDTEMTATQIEKAKNIANQWLETHARGKEE